MYFKIAKDNVVKSFKDYTIYFLTLIFAVCIFYTFNSIKAQQAMLNLSASQEESMQLVQKSMSYLSVFVSIILACLIIYANNFLIKKRKKELAIYMTLGMGKTKVSRILLLETVCVGILSLIIGLVLGGVVSQGLSILTANLFTVPMTKFTFIISGAAILKTIIYFAVIYILVMIFNVVVVSKYKLLDLLVAGRKNEKIKVKNPVISFLIFIIGLGMLIASYLIMIVKGLSDVNPFILSIVLGFVGTFLFFFGISGFLIFIIKKNKKVYFKGLNMFVVRQINNKINTNFISMSLISLMLFITITALSTGVSFKNSLEGGFKSSTPFDASLYVFGTNDVNPPQKNNIKDILAKKDFKFLPGDKYNFYTIYSSPFKFIGSNVNFNEVNHNKVDVISLTDYNNIRKLEGKSPITLKAGQTLLLANFQSSVKAFDTALSQSKEIQVGDKKYTIENDNVLKETFMTSGFLDNMGAVIVPDSDVDGLKPVYSAVNIDYGSANKEQEEQKYVDFLKTVNKKNQDDSIPYMFGTTRLSVYGEMQGLTMTVLYIVIYLGVIFLITSAAVLALQQLSEASDNVERYSALRKIGATNKMINKTVFKQILIYFAAPLSLAIIDSAVGIYAINEFISNFGQPNILTSSLIVLLLIVVTYGGYFYSTYVGVKNIVREK